MKEQAFIEIKAQRDFVMDGFVFSGQGVLSKSMTPEDLARGG